MSLIRGPILPFLLAQLNGTACSTASLSLDDLYHCRLAKLSSLSKGISLVKIFTLSISTICQNFVKIFQRIGGLFLDAS